MQALIVIALAFVAVISPILMLGAAGDVAGYLVLILIVWMVAMLVWIAYGPEEMSIIILPLCISTIVVIYMLEKALSADYYWGRVVDEHYYESIVCPIITAVDLLAVGWVWKESVLENRRLKRNQLVERIKEAILKEIDGNETLIKNVDQKISKYHQDLKLIRLLELTGSEKINLSQEISIGERFDGEEISQLSIEDCIEFRNRVLFRNKELQEDLNLVGIQKACFDKYKRKYKIR